MKSMFTKLALVSAVFFVGAGFSLDANAGGRHYYGKHYGHHYDYGYRPYRRHRYHRHYRHSRHSKRGAYLAGGLILGSLLTHAYHRSHDPVVVRDTRVIRRSADYSETRPARRLFRDRNGECFERTTNRDGDDLLIELDRSQCAW